MNTQEVYDLIEKNRHDMISNIDCIERVHLLDEIAEELYGKMGSNSKQLALRVAVYAVAHLMRVTQANSIPPPSNKPEDYIY
jgi:hypothetical protein